VRVQLLVYSGQGNPAWELTPAEAEELARRFSGLTPDPAPSQPPGLGYSGFLVQVSDAAETPQAADVLPARFTVYHGVHIGSPSGTESRRDAHGLEEWLLSLARQRGHGPLLDSLAR
jgi:hypothetical protein